MLNKIAIAVVLIALAVGLEQVVVSPLETGAAYPEYSSLRSDPMGALALYESLAKVVKVDRLYKSRMSRDPRAGTTILVLGVDPVSWSKLKVETLKEYEELTAKGARLVIAFLPVAKPWEDKEIRPVEARWHIRITYEASDTKSPVIIKAGAEWKDLGDAIERPFGGGTIVLVADSYPLSNEGLREARDAGWIVKLAGPAQEILFDENHFGVVETGSITKLMRKYHLEGALAILALVAGLFLWRSASSLLPSRAPGPGKAVTGRDSLDGMAALLRRGIPEKDLVRICYEEWLRTSLMSDKVAKNDLPQALMNDKNVVFAYREVAKTVSEKK